MVGRDSIPDIIADKIMTQEEIVEKLKSVSRGPGVYLMKDEKGVVIYVGKASNLKNRLSSYFTKAQLVDEKTAILISKIASFETIVTQTEKEALILESNLIKHHRPKYNVILKDDKRYPSLRLDVHNPYPYLRIVRKIKNDGALYFGPYASAGDVRKTLNIINKTFKLCKCCSESFKNRSRPCLNHQMGRCLAPCFYQVNHAEYQEIVKEVVMFLNGKASDLIKKIKNEMTSAADRQEFETAAELRDKLFAIEHTVEKQVAVTTDFVDRDVIGMDVNPMAAVVVVITVRDGFMRGIRQFSFKNPLVTEAEIIGAFIRQYYEKREFIPDEILVPINLEDSAIYEEWLSGLKEAKVKILHPQKGDKMRLLHIAKENANLRLKNMSDEMASGRDLLDRLQRRVRLNHYPARIECFDISGMGGREIVAGRVVFKDGRPEKSLYRKYIVRTVDIPDDYASMREVLERRFKKENRADGAPDLLMVDGGKGQLNIAVSVLNKMGIESDFDIISIAKKDEAKKEPQDKIYKPGRVNPVNFASEGELLLFLQRIRDEAHRFAISFYRRKKIKSSFHSRLDDISGIGLKRKKELLKHFSSIQKIAAASIEELASVSGMTRKAAEMVKKALAETMSGS